MTLRNFLPSLYTRKQLEIDRIKSGIEIDFPGTKEELIQFVKNNNLIVADLDNLAWLLVAVKNW